MTQLGHAAVRLDVRWARFLRLAFRALWDRLLACSAPLDRQHTAARYRRLQSCSLPPSPSPSLRGHRRPSSSPAEEEERSSPAPATVVGPTRGYFSDPEVEPDDLVALKITLLGDCHVGKTCFMNKYVGNVEEQRRGLHMTGLNLMDKVLFVRGARIALSIWDVNGDHQFLCHVPIACKDSVAILIMFDLTRRCTLNNAISWYCQARKWNKGSLNLRNSGTWAASLLSKSFLDYKIHLTSKAKIGSSHLLAIGRLQNVKVHPRSTPPDLKRKSLSAIF